MRLYARYIKRILDIILALFLIIILSPLLLIISILVLIFHGRPIIFKQERPGYKEDVFSMYKFRSMTDEKDENGEYLPSNYRITKFGKIIRKTSLDELPELFNILKGDMSFIGPRPLLAKYLPYYEEEERRRHDVRPGLTGYSQVMGRNKLTWRERFEYDVYYVDHVSFLFDLKIIFKTIQIVFKGSGVADAGEVRTDEFGDYLLHNGRKYRPLDKEREYEAHLKSLGEKNE